MTENDPVLYARHSDAGVMSSVLKVNAYNNLHDDFHYTLKMKVVAKITIFDGEGESCFSRRRKAKIKSPPILISAVRSGMSRSRNSAGLFISRHREAMSR